MTKTQTYNVEAYTLDDQTNLTRLGVVTAPTPSAALRKVCGDDLAEHKGRYGSLKDGRRVMALLVHGGRAYYGRGSDDHLAKLLNGGVS
jgi:hypothetical protein